MELVGVESNAVYDEFGLGDLGWAVPEVDLNLMLFAEGFHISLKPLVELDESLSKIACFPPILNSLPACSSQSFPDALAVKAWGLIKRLLIAADNFTTLFSEHQPLTRWKLFR